MAQVIFLLIFIVKNNYKLIFNYKIISGTGFTYDFIDRNDPKGYRSYYNGGNLKSFANANPGKSWKIVW